MAATDTDQLHLATFVATCQAVQIASVDDAGQPHNGHYPCAGSLADGLLFLSSGLAPQHRSLSGRASLLLLGPQTENPFRRPRVIAEASLCCIDPTSADWQLGLASMQQRFGAVVDLLAGLGDFSLIRARVEGGRWVRGFGDAWTFDHSGQLQAIDAERLQQGQP
ncbi:hypothetical protein OAS86_04645 [Gammaproteobacteria bacterium]|nr:hypothetical protein [Gammaproteobacteria bacterium]